MMMGLYFTEQVPFQDVYIHALVRDPYGQKMSKSKGNVIDPLELMEQHGTDALRFTLTAFAAQGRDIKLSEERVLGYRNFCNKIWNASRFLLSTASPSVNWKSFQTALDDPKTLPTSHEFSQWILTKLSECVATVRQALEEYRFNEAALSAYQFFWGTFCDWYLEFIKETLKSDTNSLREEFATVALYVLDQALRLLHPLMPFITEELWQALCDRQGELLPRARFPTVLPEESLARFQKSQEKIEALKAVFEKVRQIRMETGVPLSQPLKRVSIYSKDDDLLQDLQKLATYAYDLAGLSKLSVNDTQLRAEKGIARGVTSHEDVVVLVDLKGLVDLDKERQRQEKEIAKLQKGLAGVEKTLKNPKFIQKAPVELVEEKKLALQSYEAKILEVEEALKLL